MPICKHCIETFPNRLLIDNKYRNLSKRLYCLKCSPFGLHNTQPLHKRTPESERKIGALTECSCGRVYRYEKRKGHSKQRCNSCIVNQRRFALKIRAVEYKGGRCSRCGYDRCLPAIHFHHRDPTQKDFSLGGRHTISWIRIKEELDKCEILCSNCHTEVHEKIRLSHNS